MPAIKTLKTLFAPKDMTEGAPWKRIAEFMIPMLIGNVAQQLYNTADSIIVGRYIGDNALAAVGSAGPILHLLLVLFMGISMGAGIMVSQYFGANCPNRHCLSNNHGSRPPDKQAITYSYEHPAFYSRLVRRLPEYFLPGWRRLCFL
jgi:hypothetical protein